MADGSGGDARGRAIVVSSAGAGSTVKLNSLTTFTDALGGDTNLADNNAFSRLDAYAGGTLQTPALITLDGVYIDEDASSTISTNQITTLTDGQIDFTGGVTYALGNVTNLARTIINVSGSGRVATFSKATNIDGANFFVAGARTCRFPWQRVTVMRPPIVTRSVIFRQPAPAAC